MSITQAGQKLLESFFENTGGINLSDSTFTISPGQATDGYNFDYVKTGGIQKSLCPAKTSSSADAQLKTLGLFLRNTRANSKSIIRAAGTKIQLANISGAAFTNLAEDDTAATTDFLNSSSTQPVVGVMTTTPTANVLWLTGGGSSGIYGVPSDSVVTANGVIAPTGALALSETVGGGSWSTTGTYYYSVAYRKRSTQSLSNADLDLSVAVSLVTNTIEVDLSGLTNVDTTLYDKVYLYRSAVSGASAFTTGSLVAQIDITTTSYEDTGSSLTSTTNVPRDGNTVLDNSVLPSGTFETLTLFKRRLVTASESTVYLSDLNKFESWPATNVIEVPSGGKITGLAVISFTTPSATTTDEFLAIFKEQELWIITGDSSEDWSLKFIDSTGSANQSLIVGANGYMYFIDQRGIYLWDGAGKPVYISRIIEDIFSINGKLDKSKLHYGFGTFFRRQNEVIWCLSTTADEQKYMLKLDLRLTLPQVSNTLGQRIMDGVFIQGLTASGMYAGSSFMFPTSSNQEDVFVSGDNAGYLYRMFYNVTGTGANDYNFYYDTNYLDMGKPKQKKRYEKVIAWVEGAGDWDLTLDYWTDFKTDDGDKNSISIPLSTADSSELALWDVGQWDVASWDGYKARPRPIIYNLNAAPYNNAEGEVIKLRFRNQNSAEPILIYGFSVLYSNMGMVA